MACAASGAYMTSTRRQARDSTGRRRRRAVASRKALRHGVAAEQAPIARRGRQTLKLRNEANSGARTARGTGRSRLRLPDSGHPGRAVTLRHAGTGRRTDLRPLHGQRVKVASAT